MKMTTKSKIVTASSATTKKRSDFYRSISLNPKRKTMKKSKIETQKSGEFRFCESQTVRVIRKKEDLKKSQNQATKNEAEAFELFEIAKKSADVANAKGILLGKEESSLCVDTLCLLLNYEINGKSVEARRIMEKLERLTKHKDRKICNSAYTLLRHWSQCN